LIFFITTITFGRIQVTKIYLTITVLKHKIVVVFCLKKDLNSFFRDLEHNIRWQFFG